MILKIKAGPVELEIIEDSKIVSTESGLRALTSEAFKQMRETLNVGNWTWDETATVDTEEVRDDE